MTSSSTKQQPRLELQLESIVAANGGTQLLSKILQEFEKQDRSVAELKVMSMANSGIFSIRRDGKEYMVTLEKKINTKIERATQTTSVVGIAATIPFSLQPGEEYSDILTTEEVFDQLLSSTRVSVKLSLPFPEEAIMMHFASRLRDLARRRVRLQVLTREIFSLQAANDSYQYLALAKSLLRMWDIYRVVGKAELFEIRDFHRNIRSSTPKPMHYESVHAKIVSVDTKRCYVGSAEFRLNSLFNNFELGLVVGEDVAVQVESLYDLVWYQAKPLSYEQIQKSVGFQDSKQSGWHQSPSRWGKHPT